MAFVLVRWLKEDRVSVIPPSWVVQPNPVPAQSELPVKGICSWRKKGNKYDTMICKVSDSRSSLEEELERSEDEEDEQPEKEQEQPSEPAAKQQLSEQPKGGEKNKKRQATDDDQLTVTVKRRKKNKQEEKAIKDAKIAAADRLAETIFQKSFSCSACSSLKTTVSSLEEDIRLKNDEISQLRSEVADLKESVKVKKLLITTLELENKQLKCRIAKQDHSPKQAPPTASTKTVSFLTNLVEYYKDKYSTLESDDSSSSEEEDLCDLEKTRRRNVKRNEMMKVTLGLKTPPHVQGKTETQSGETATGSPSAATPERTVTIGNYTYTVTPADLQREQQAFEAGEGKRELVKGFGVYIKYVDLEQAEQMSKSTATGLMRALMSVWYWRERLAGCSATSGINNTIKTCIFKFCEERFGASIDKLKRDLTSKCGEERRKLRGRGAQSNH